MPDAHERAYFGIQSPYVRDQDLEMSSTETITAASITKQQKTLLSYWAN